MASGAIQSLSWDVSSTPAIRSLSFELVFYLLISYEEEYPFSHL
jgi:hypothetical protein